jgi:outer membrane protein OmpA-like peptidoglycan-associated protein
MEDPSGMRRFRLWSSLLLLSFVAVPAFAQVAGHPFEFSGQAGIFSPDARSRAKTGPAYGFSLGYRLEPWLVLEGSGLFAPSEADTTGEPTLNFSTFSADLRFNLRPGESKVVPYFLAGMGYGRSNGGGVEPELREKGAASIGAGALFNLMGKPRWYMRAQVRDIFFRNGNDPEFSQHFGAMVGLHYIFGGKYKDVDLDGVRDWLDECPATPIGARVDAKGCPIDSDGDGVPDGIDKCPDTPRGATVDKTGCPADLDADGVFDGIDKCPDTPPGKSVDATGCPNDDDGDKVINGVDQCPNTPSACPVDEKGCPIDSDGDGVCDGMDQCPNTPSGLKVNENGCPVIMIEHETELLDTGTLRLREIQFETNKATIKPESFETLDIVGKILGNWPQLRIEIGGHTDDVGATQANQKLSEARAKAVESYLFEKFPNLDKAQFSAKGYGESRPVVPNRDETSRALNRRVEFVVQNKDVLRKEIEKRRMLQKGEPAPETPKK